MLYKALISRIYELYPALTLIKLHQRIKYITTHTSFKGSEMKDCSFVFPFLLFVCLSFDVSREDGSFGRDDHLGPNCKMKRVDVDGKPHVCLFAIEDKQQGEEMTYDYGGDDCPWRMQVSDTTSVMLRYDLK